MARKAHKKGKKAADLITPKEARFIEEYLIDLNGTRAAKAAGYKGSDDSIRKIASRLVTKVDIKRIIKKRLAEKARKNAVSAKNVLLELSRIAFFDPATIFNDNGNLKDIHAIDEGSRRAISAIETRLEGGRRDGQTPELVTKIKFVDKPRALEMLARHLGILIDKSKVEVTGKGGEPLVSVDENTLVKVFERLKRRVEGAK